MIARKYKIGTTSFSGKKPDLVVSNQYFSLKKYTNNTGHNRFAVIISAKTMSRAADRHFWKRFFFNTALRLPPGNMDYIFLIHTPIEKKASIECRRAIDKIAQDNT